MASFPNPFPNDPDRAAIWIMLVERDIAAFVDSDWDMVADDFLSEQFLGIDGRGSDNPDSWRVGFPTLDAYRDEWLRQAAESAKVAYAEDRKAALHRATTLQDQARQADAAAQLQDALVLDLEAMHRMRQRLASGPRLSEMTPLRIGNAEAGAMPIGVVELLRVAEDAQAIQMPADRQADETGVVTGHDSSLTRRVSGG